MAGTRALYTIGHSTRTRAELFAVLRAWKVETLVDIRHFTRSRANPQFDRQALARALRRAGIAYIAMPELGGFRRRAHRDAHPNAGWQNASFENYADYAETPEFAEAFERLLALAARSRCAVMCAEAVWWRCHRRIVADYAIARGVPVIHIFTQAKATPATLTPFARVHRRQHIVRYPGARRTAHYRSG